MASRERKSKNEEAQLAEIPCSMVSQKVATIFDNNGKTDRQISIWILARNHLVKLWMWKLAFWAGVFNSLVSDPES